MDRNEIRKILYEEFGYSLLKHNGFEKESCANLERKNNNLTGFFEEYSLLSIFVAMKILEGGSNAEN